MAIKRTTQRQNYVGNYGIVDTGAKSLAQSTLDLGRVVGNITATVDDAQLKQAYIDAEKEGILLGTKVGKDGKIAPLDMVQLNSYKPDMFNKANQRKAIAFFKDKAIQSYKSAITADALDSAENSFLKNQGKMADNNKLITANEKEAYINGIRNNLSTEIFQQIQPALNEVWDRSVRKSSAVHLDGVRKQNVANGVKSLNLINQKEFAIRTGVGSSESKNAELEDLENEKNQVFALLNDNSSSSSEVESYKSDYDTTLQAKISANAIDVAVAAGVPIYEQRQMVDDTVKSFAGKYDTKIIADAMTSRISYHDRIKKDKKAEENLIRQDNYYKILFKISTAKNASDLPTVQEIQTDLGGINNYSASAIQVLTGRSSNLKKIEKTEFDNQGLLKLVQLKSDAISDTVRKDNEDFFFDNKSNLSARTYANFLDYKLQRFAQEIKTQNVKSMQGYLYDMEYGKTYSIPPNVYLSSLEEFEKSGLVGSKSTSVMNRDQYLSKVSAYASRYNKYMSLVGDVKVATNLNNAGASTPDNLVTSMKQLGNELIYPTKVTFGGQSYEMNILSEDQTISELSMIRAAEWMVRNRRPLDEGGIFSAINNFAVLPQESYDKVLQFYKTVLNTARIRGISKAEVDQYMFKGFNMEYINMASTIQTDRESIQKMALAGKDSVSLNRVESLISNKNQSLEEVFTNSLSDFSDEYVFSFSSVLRDVLIGVAFPGMSIDPEDSDLQREAGEKWAEITAGGGFVNAVKTNPILFNKMIKSFRYNLMSEKVDWSQGNDNGIKQAMTMTLVQVMEHVGMSKNADGTSTLTMYPVLQEFQKTSPSPDIVLTDDDVKNYIHDHFSDVPAIRDLETKEAFDNKSFKIVANEVTGNVPSYRVYIQKPGGAQTLLSNNFIFDFKYSKNNDAYKIALAQLKNDRFGSSIFKALPGLDKMKLKSLYNKWNKGMSNENFLKSLIGLYNNAVINVLPMASNDDIIDPDSYTLAKARALILSLGLDYHAWKMDPQLARNILDDQ